MDHQQKILWKGDMRLRQWVLDGHVPRQEPDILAWAAWFEDRDARRVALAELSGGRVSTVFLGLDHNFMRHGPPLLFETMVFMDDGRGWCDQERYATWDEAEAGHKRMVEKYERSRDTGCGAPRSEAE